ncbi:MAG: hypothetical protein V1781_07195 [Bacteroidota bacterium]
MSVNFFQNNCQNNTTDTSFGLCDDENGTPAFIDSENKNQWIGVVENNKAIEIIFTAIDNCIPILRDDGNMDNRCDGMLTYTDNIVFVELKNQRKNWITDAVNQIETTIKHFIANHDLSNYRHKRAFVANKKHPQFNFAIHEKSQIFYSQYKVRLNISVTIKI